MRRGGVGQPWKVRYAHSSFGALNPTCDGLSVLTTTGGVYGLQAKPIKTFPESQLLPIHGADLFLQIDKAGHARVLDLDFHEKAPVFDPPQGFKMKTEPWASGRLYGDEPIMASARANKMVLIDNNALTVSILSLGLAPADVPPAALPAPGAQQPAPAPMPTPPAIPAPSAPTSPPTTTGTATPTPPAPGDEQMKKDCQAWSNMADNYERSGLARQAREYLQKIVERYPGSPYAQRATERLRTLRE